MRVVQRVHELLSQVVKPGEIVVDATVGNGHDTLKLAELVRVDSEAQIGRVIAIDIQKQALDIARIKLEDAGFFNVEWHLLDHAELDHVVPDNVAAVIMNLGYLPSGDHSIRTNSHSTVQAISAACLKLRKDGVITIVSYVGHLGGKEEDLAVKQFCSTLDPQAYEVVHEPAPVENSPRLTVIRCLAKRNNP
jgi:tRNA G37 N-methylase Trm5